MSIPGLVDVVGSRNIRSVDDQPGLIDGIEYRNRSNCRDIGGHGRILDGPWTTTGAREHDGQRPDRHQPSSLRARVVFVLCPCVLWLNFSLRGRDAWGRPAYEGSEDFFRPTAQIGCY